MACGSVPSLPLAQSLPDDHSDKQRALERLQGDMAKSEAHQKELENRKADVSRTLADLQMKLVRAANSIQENEDQATTLETRVAELDDKVMAQTAALNERRGDMAITLAALGRVTRQPPELVFLRPSDSIDTVRSARLLSSAMPALRAEADALRQDLDLLRQLKAELDEERESLAKSLGSLESERQAMDQLLAKRKAEQSSLDQETTVERQRLTRMAAEAQSLESFIKSLEQELERRRKAAADAELRLSKRPDQDIKTAAVAPKPKRPAAVEPDQNLPLPVRGQLVRRFGAPDDAGGTSKGIVIESRVGAQVVSPADGRVVFAGPFRDYGHILIIAHDGGYHTLLAGMTKVSAVVDQAVLAGEPIGQMAETIQVSGGSSTSAGNRLYVELRSNGTPVNPMRWLAAGKGKVRG